MPAAVLVCAVRTPIGTAQQRNPTADLATHILSEATLRAGQAPERNDRVRGLRHPIAASGVRIPTALRRRDGVIGVVTPRAGSGQGGHVVIDVD